MAKVPQYRKHSTRQIGFCEYQKKRYYFPGKFNSPESLSAYAEFIKSIAGQNAGEVVETDLRITKGDNVPICVLCAEFLDWAKNRYQKNGRSTGTYTKNGEKLVFP